jgi:drug/metabolite transporter superfamily protein YnfA
VKWKRSPHITGSHIMTIHPWLIFITAALLEVAGDATIRRGLRGGGIALILAGLVVLGSYGLIVNTVRWDFSKLIGVYIAFFALTSVLFGRYVFSERVPRSTWLGLALIIAGGLVIQFGHRIKL